MKRGTNVKKQAKAKTPESLSHAQKVAFVALRREVYNQHPAGGNLHIVTDDHNVTAEDLEHCAKSIEAETLSSKQRVELACLEFLQTLTEEQRLELVLEFLQTLTEEQRLLACLEFLQTLTEEQRLELVQIPFWWGPTSDPVAE